MTAPACDPWLSWAPRVGPHRRQTCEACARRIAVRASGQLYRHNRQPGVRCGGRYGVPPVVTIRPGAVL